MRVWLRMSLSVRVFPSPIWKFCGGGDFTAPVVGLQGFLAELIVEKALPCGDEPKAPGIGVIIPFVLTTGTFTSAVFNANNQPGVTLEGSVTGENFSCDQWTETDGPGILVFNPPVVGFLFLPGDFVVAWVFDD